MIDRKKIAQLLLELVLLDFNFKTTVLPVYLIASTAEIQLIGRTCSE
jgi:hypothetical protein